MKFEKSFELDPRWKFLEKEPSRSLKMWLRLPSVWQWQVGSTQSHFTRHLASRPKV